MVSAAPAVGLGPLDLGLPREGVCSLGRLTEVPVDRLATRRSNFRLETGAPSSDFANVGQVSRESEGQLLCRSLTKFGRVSCDRPGNGPTWPHLVELLRVACGECPMAGAAETNLQVIFGSEVAGTGPLRIPEPRCRVPCSPSVHEASHVSGGGGFVAKWGLTSLMWANSGPAGMARREGNCCGTPGPPNPSFLGCRAFHNSGD